MDIGCDKMEPETVTINNRIFNVYPYEEAHKYFGYVYVTINKINSKKYIGISYKKRGSTKGYLGSGTYLKSALSKYGRSNFKKYIIDTAGSKYYLLHLELLYIRYYFGENCATSSNWYNINDGLQHGGNLWKGLSNEDRAIKGKKIARGIKKWAHSHPEEVKIKSQKSSKFMKEYFKNPDNRKKASITTKEGMKSGIVRERMKRPHNKARGVSKGPQSSDLRIKLSKARKGRTPWNKGKLVPELTRISKAINSKIYVVNYGDKSYFIIASGIDDLIIKGRDTITNKFPCRGDSK